MLIKQLLEQEMQNVFPILQSLHILCHAAKQMIFLAPLDAGMYLLKSSCCCDIVCGVEVRN